MNALAPAAIKAATDDSRGFFLGCVLNGDSGHNEMQQTILECCIYFVEKREKL